MLTRSRSAPGAPMPKGKTIEETQKRTKEPEDKWEKSTVLGPERGLGEGIGPRDKVDVPVEIPADMSATSGQRSEYLWDVYALPTPIVIVTTTDHAGNVNAAVKNWCTPAGSHGFLFVCSTDHDTYRNLQTTGEFVVNVPGPDLVDRFHALSRKGAASWENELQRAGLTPLPGRKLRPPRIKECRLHMECRVELLHEVDSVRELIGEGVEGKEKLKKSEVQGTDVLVFGKIQAVSGDAVIVRAPTYQERLKLLRPMVLGPIWNYGVVEEWREVPQAWDMEY